MQGFAGRAVLAMSAVLMLLSAPALGADNAGLGPLSIRNQFPVTMGFLTYTPESPVGLPADTFQFRYQMAVTNTFINTQSPLIPAPPFIDRNAVIRPGGLTPADFSPTGYGLYLDMEAQRHQMRFNYGLSDSLEVGLELAWITLGGGTLDANIEGVERFFGGLNEDRVFSDRDRFDFYVIRDGVFLQRSTQPFSGEALDPVVKIKWTLGEGNEVLPSFSVKLAWKVPLDPNPTGARQLISSGKKDFGYYFLFGKQIGDVVAHMQFGLTQLEQDPNTFAERLKHRMFALEFRLDEDTSFVLQSVTQSSIFLRGFTTTSRDYALSTQTDVGVLGFTHKADGFLYEFGTIEDYNQQRNESDITLFFELGWEW